MFRAVLTGAGRLAHGRPGDTFRGWLWTITRNKLHDFRRRAGPTATGGSDARDRLLLVPDANSESASGTPTAGALLGPAVAAVRAEFEDRTWRAFWLMTVDGRGAADVARELGMTANAVYVARHRVLRRLREVVADDNLGATPPDEPAE